MASTTPEIRERHIPATYDRKGNPSWRSTMSPPDNSVAVVAMVPDRIIPVIFVPGVMGSNLLCSDGDTTWLLNDGPTMFKQWRLKAAQSRKKLLDPMKCTVYSKGAIPTSTDQSEEELRRRGWGEVGAMSYGEFLVWLENALNDFDEPHAGKRDALLGQLLGARGERALSRQDIGLSYRYRFPVHACGYNWLQDNKLSAERLKQRIREIQVRYRADRKKCEQVILVTHSMGGLVARHCVENLGMSDQVMGIVHGVMPAIGAPAVYRRMKAGTESDGSFMGAQAAAILGGDAAEVTAVLSAAAGPLQLLPTPEYGADWLKIMDEGREVLSLPKAGPDGKVDPYGQIYAVRGQWWSMCEDDLINPLKPDYPDGSIERRTQLDGDWKTFTQTLKLVKAFHTDVSAKYHACSYAFYGNSDAYKAFGTVTWKQSLRRRGTSLETDPLSGRTGPGSQLLASRTIVVPVTGHSDYARFQVQRYTLAGPDEAGDGTVPRRSGAAPTPRMRASMTVAAGHEPVYRESESARLFTLQSIVHIAQNVSKTGLAYP